MGGSLEGICRSLLWPVLEELSCGIRRSRERSLAQHNRRTAVRPNGTTPRECDKLRVQHAKHRGWRGARKASSKDAVEVAQKESTLLNLRSQTPGHVGSECSMIVRVCKCFTKFSNLNNRILCSSVRRTVTAIKGSSQDVRVESERSLKIFRNLEKNC